MLSPKDDIFRLPTVAPRSVTRGQSQRRGVRTPFKSAIDDLMLAFFYDVSLYLFFFFFKFFFLV